jgi:hypothetical protein
MSNFQLEISQWETAGQDSPERLSTTGRLRLQVGKTVLTEHEDTFSQRVEQEVLVSAYPLAYWLASNWWRLLYEPYPLNEPPSTDWRMAHEIPATNEGYIWPAVQVFSQGPSVELRSNSTSPSKLQSIRYLTSLSKPELVPRGVMVKRLTDFISSTLAQLKKVGLASTELSDLWDELSAELDDDETRSYRIIEACLGYDPDEAPSELVSGILNLKEQAGIETLEEIAPLLRSAVPGSELSMQELVASLANRGLTGRPNIPLPANIARLSYFKSPWVQAVSAAQGIRRILQPTQDKLATSKLYELLGLDETSISINPDLARIQLSLGVRRPDGIVSFHLRHSMPTTRRFELARFIADFILSSGSGSGWLACNELKTWRQQYQRAFAAELLCPSDSIKQYIYRKTGPYQFRGNIDDDMIQDIAELYEVSDFTVRRVLYNNKMISRSMAMLEEV